MTKAEFLKELSDALSTTQFHEFNREQIRYYRQYIEDEVAKGKTEEQVCEELGSPRLIARTIKDAAGFGDESAFNEDGSFRDTEPEEDESWFDRQYSKVKNIRYTGWKATAAVVVFFLVFFGIMALILWGLTSVFIAIAPIMAPVIMIGAVVLFFWSLFHNMRK